MATNLFFLVGKCNDGSFCVYQNQGRIRHNGGQIIALCTTATQATEIASALNDAAVLYDLTKTLPQFEIGR